MQSILRRARSVDPISRHTVDKRNVKVCKITHAGSKKIKNKKEELSRGN